MAIFPILLFTYIFCQIWKPQFNCFALIRFLPADFLTDTPTLEHIQLRFCRFKSITGECVAANLSNFAFQESYSVIIILQKPRNRFLSLELYCIPTLLVCTFQTWRYFCFSYQITKANNKVNTKMTIFDNKTILKRGK